MDAIPSLPDLSLVRVDAARCGLEGPRLSYMEAGSGPPVVLLHGIGSWSGGWRYVLDGLSGEARTIAWNAPGYAVSDSLAAEGPANDDYAAVLAAFLDALGLDAVHLVGSSFGGLVAATFAARYPERVRRLALLAPSRGNAHLPAEERERVLLGRADSIKEGGLGLAETRWANLVAADASPTAIRLTQGILGMTHRRGYLQSVRTIDTTDILDLAGAIRAATLVAVGSEDRVNPPDVAREVHAAIAGARFVLLPNVGHLPKLETPAETVALLRSHLLADA
jgi:pimeloyl-ACP methyl ester carboxylesterase